MKFAALLLLLSSVGIAQIKMGGGTNTGGVASVGGTAPIVSSGGSNPVISLPNTAVTPATYTCPTLTIDAQGRITNASNGTCTGGSGGGGGGVPLFAFDCGGVACSTSQTECTYFQNAFTLTGVVIQAKPSGSGTFDIQTAPYASGYAAASTIVGSGTTPAISSNTQAKPAITGFSASVAADSWVCVAMTSPSSSNHFEVTLEGSSGGGGGGPTCTSGVVNYSDLTTAGTAQEISPSALASLPGSTRYSEVIISESTQFSGGSATALTASIGRTGTNNSELTGANVPLMVSGGDANFWPVGSPPPPILTGTYDLVVAFKSTGANVNTFTAGKATWEVCTYAGQGR